MAGIFVLLFKVLASTVVPATTVDPAQEAIQSMTQITSHILDTSAGRPAAGVKISLLRQLGDAWQLLGSASTNDDGRVADFTGNDDALAAGTYKLTFYLSDYYAGQKQSSFYPFVDVVFGIEGDGQHYHVPLLLNPFGYSTYRGS